MLFFPSRVRHTGCLSDWSSDVCSSDLLLPAIVSFLHSQFVEFGLGRVAALIGRASCRERVYSEVVAGGPEPRTFRNRASGLRRTDADMRYEHVSAIEQGPTGRDRRTSY